MNDGPGTPNTPRKRFHIEYPLFNALKQTTFRSLRHRNYRLYFFGQIVSFTGSWMQSAALMWLMYDLTGDLRWPSYLLVAQVGPTVLLGAWGGELADRWPKRTLIMITQSAFLLNALLLSLLVGSGAFIPSLVIALQVFNGVIQGIDLPARLAFVPDLVPKEDLINAVGLNSLLFNSARAVGPAVAGVIFTTVKESAAWFPEGTSLVRVGAVSCFAINALSYVAVLFALAAIHVADLSLSDRRHSVGSVWDGVRYLRKHRSLGGLVLATLMFCIFAWPVLTLFPGYTRTTLGRNEESYTLLVSALGAGALVAAFTTATYGNVARRGLFLVLGAVVTTVGLSGLSAVSELWIAAGFGASVGFGLILFLSTGQSTLQLAVPNETRGRVMALWAVTLSASAPLGHLLAGQVAEAIGVVPVLRVMAVGVGLVALVVMVTRRGVWA